jgi:ABC-type phosphate/phosphonate transport system permease subunit
MDTQNRVAKFKNRINILFWLIFLAFFVYSFQTIMDFEDIAHPRHQESFVRMLTVLSKPDFSDDETNRQTAAKMWETIQIAFLATTLGAILAIPFTFFTARPSSFLGRGFNILLQPILSAVRAVHPLIITIPAIVLAGMGPTAGVLALTLFSTAVLIGNFSEYAQQHTSVSWNTLFKIHCPGLALKYLPVNILIATVLGFMGGGGIGFLLQQHLITLNYGDASVAILVCIIVIGSIDLLSRAVWRKIQTTAEPHNISIKSERDRMPLTKVVGDTKSNALQKPEGAMTSKSQQDIESIYADYYQTAMNIQKASARASFPFLIPSLIILAISFMEIQVGAIPEFLLGALAILFGVAFFIASGVRTKNKIAKVAQTKKGFDEFCQLGFDLNIIWKNYWKKEFPTGEKLENFLDIIGELQK